MTESLPKQQSVTMTDKCRPFELLDLFIGQLPGISYHRMAIAFEQGFSQEQKTLLLIPGVNKPGFGQVESVLL